MKESSLIFPRLSTKLILRLRRKFFGVEAEFRFAAYDTSSLGKRGIEWALVNKSYLTIDASFFEECGPSIQKLQAPESAESSGIITL